MTEPAEIVGGVPVFRPTMEQFSDFYQYMTSINEHGMRSGIVKVVPPAEWTAKLPKPTREKLMSIKIRNPITQHISGQGGVFAQQNVEKARSYNIVQWKALSQEPQFQPPAPRGKNRPSVDASALKRHRYILSNKSLKDKSVFDDFDYNIDTSEFTSERCEQLEKVYWKSLLYTDPMYGADMIGSIFDDSVKEWNVAHLPNVLDYMEEKLPGVNDAYLYAGLWKATFSWHLEDQDLYSINYLHFGAPKQWYSIPQAYKDKFDDIMRETFPQEYAHCPDFLRHKTFLVSPSVLESNGVPVNKIVHNQGEFMITYPFGYHAGMNYGYNVAESVNFALEEWFEYGLKTTKCMCINDAVGINLEILMRRFKGEPEPERYSDPDSDSEPELVSGPESEHTRIEENIRPLDHRSLDEKRSPKNKLHVTLSKSEPPSANQRKRDHYNEDSASPPGIKKIRLSVPQQDQILKNTRGPQCILCPNTISPDGIQFEEFSLLPTQEFLLGTSKKPDLCHKICAEMIHETTIGKVNGVECLVGLGNVPAARKRLKCVLCHKSNKGACFQCAGPKCLRAYHATCALPAGVYLGTGENDVWCKVHRNRAIGEKGVNSKKKYLESVNVGDLIQVKFGGYFSGVVICKNTLEDTLTIDLYPTSEETTTMEVPNESVQIQGVKISLKANTHTNVSSKPTPQITKSTAEVADLTTPTPDPPDIALASDPTVSVPPVKRVHSRRPKEFDILNLKDPRYSYTVGEIIGHKLILEKLSVTESANVANVDIQFWYYKPDKSSDLKARYVDDFFREEPNDPESLKKRLRKSRKKIKPGVIVIPSVSSSPRPVDPVIAPGVIDISSHSPTPADLTVMESPRKEFILSSGAQESSTTSDTSSMLDFNSVPRLVKPSGHVLIAPKPPAHAHAGLV